MDCSFLINFASKSASSLISVSILCLFPYRICALCARSLDAIMGFVASDATIVEVDVSRLNKEEISKGYSAAFAAFPNLVVKIDRLVSEGNTVVMENFSEHADSHIVVNEWLSTCVR